MTSLVRRHPVPVFPAVCAALILGVTAACTGAGAPDPRMTTADLRALVPEIPEWARGEINAQRVEVPEPATVATVRYTHSDGGHLDLEISDTGGASPMIDSLASMAGTAFNRDMPGGYLKGTTVAGSPAVESWNTDHLIGELTVLVRGRYIIHVGGAGLADAAPMRMVVERMDLTLLK